MKFSELEKILRKGGCKIHRQGSSHCIWYSEITKRKFSVSRHKTEEVPIGTLKSIMRDAGLE